MYLLRVVGPKKGGGAGQGGIIRRRRREKKEGKERNMASTTHLFQSVPEDILDSQSKPHVYSDPSLAKLHWELFFVTRTLCLMWYLHRGYDTEDEITQELITLLVHHSYVDEKTREALLFKDFMTFLKRWGWNTASTLHFLLILLQQTWNIRPTTRFADEKPGRCLVLLYIPKKMKKKEFQDFVEECTMKAKRIDHIMLICLHDSIGKNKKIALEETIRNERDSLLTFEYSFWSDLRYYIHDSALVSTYRELSVHEARLFLKEQKSTEEQISSLSPCDRVTMFHGFSYGSWVESVSNSASNAQRFVFVIRVDGDKRTSLPEPVQTEDWSSTETKTKTKPSLHTNSAPSPSFPMNRSLRVFSREDKKRIEDTENRIRPSLTLVRDQHYYSSRPSVYSRGPKAPIFTKTSTKKSTKPKST